MGHGGNLYAYVHMPCCCLPFAKKEKKQQHYSVPDRIALVKACRASNYSPTVAWRKLTTKFKLKTTDQNVLSIINLIHKFEGMDSVRDNRDGNFGCPKRVTTLRRHMLCMTQDPGNWSDVLHNRWKSTGRHCDKMLLKTNIQYSHLLAIKPLGHGTVIVFC